MPDRRLAPWLPPVALAAALAAADAAAAPVEVCELPPRYGVEATAAAIVRTACEEHRLWFRPFIEADGRLAELAVTEAERVRLDDDSTRAWQRVARYWRDSGTLASMAAGGTPGAASCQLPHGERAVDNDCRAFLLDNPWSAAFVSWVMVQAAVPGFGASPRHMDYIARAWRQPAASPWLYDDPHAGKPAPGDLLCYLRAEAEGLGAAGLRSALAGQSPMPWHSHCDIVVAANVGGDRTLYLIGGNVLNTVLMRKLPLDRSGRLAADAFGPAPDPAAATVSQSQPAAADAAAGASDAGAPRSGTPPEDTASIATPRSCSPGNPAACSFNHRDWAVLLKLKPQAQLDTLAPGPRSTEPPLPEPGDL